VKNVSQHGEKCESVTAVHKQGRLSTNLETCGTVLLISMTHLSRTLTHWIGGCVDPSGHPDRRLHRKSNPDAAIAATIHVSSASAQSFSFTPSLALKSVYVLTFILILLLIGELFFRYSANN
jgi:hypothetical protein